MYILRAPKKQLIYLKKLKMVFVYFRNVIMSSEIAFLFLLDMIECVSGSASYTYFKHKLQSHSKLINCVD